MTQNLPEALKRVVVYEDATQSEAALIKIDPSGKIDAAHLTLNPDLVPPDAVDGYRIRAAIAASLEGFHRYHRNIVRRYGAFEAEEALFTEAAERATSELDQLVHLAPRSPELLPDTLRQTPDEALLAQPDFGEKRLEALREAPQ